MSKAQASIKESAGSQRQSSDTQLGWKMILLGGVAVAASSLFGFSTLNLPEQRLLFTHLLEAWDRVLNIRMRSILLAGSYLCAGCFTQLSTVDGYLQKQIPISKAGMLDNIGPSGIKSSGAEAGVVIASPSIHDPDYLYTWTRDAALVLKTIIEQYTRGEDESLRSTIDDYVAAQTILQQVSNPSGTVETGGLAEPKFHINLTAFTDSWGRPQRDGPALRATALIQYVNWLITSGNVSYVIDIVWPVIKLDLDYTITNWNQSGFDLWEEVSSSSFFTTAVQLRSLREGASLATKLNQSTSALEYNKQVPNVYCFLQSYWNPTENYVTSNTAGGRSGKDANSVIASIHNFDAAAGCDATTFQPCSDKALANHKAYVDAFRSIYTINHGIDHNAAVATGRYSEDIYYNGNPWYLTTFAAAEQLYDALIVWDRAGELYVTSISLPFFRQFSPSVTVGTYLSSSPIYAALTSAIRSFADGFVAVAANYTPLNGSLSEQYDRNTGDQLSAKDLTWSYATLLTMSAARSGFVQDSWGAADLILPEACSGSSGATVAVIFNVEAKTASGENIYVTGSVDALAQWSPDKALLLSSENYPIWSITVRLPANTQFEYKYIRKDKHNVVWESDPNRSSLVPASGTHTIVDTWR